MKKVTRQGKSARKGDLMKPKKRSRPGDGRRREQDEEPPLSEETVAELKRRWDDIRDPRRYVIVSAWTHRHAMIYDAADGMYCMDHVKEGCFFKRRECAEAVAKVLDGRRPERDARFRHHVVAVERTRTGARGLDTIANTWDQTGPIRLRIRGARLGQVRGEAETDPRVHVARGMLFAVTHAPDIARVLKDCRSHSSARRRLMTDFSLTAAQAEAALNLRFHHLTRRERSALKREVEVADRPRLKMLEEKFRREDAVWEKRWRRKLSAQGDGP